MHRLLFICYIAWPISHTSWILGVNVVCIFVNKSVALQSLGPLLALKEAVSLQRSTCSWALYLTPWQVYSPTKGQGEEWSALGVSQLGLVYFPPLSNKRHFLVLMAWKESVIKIQARGVTKRETEPRLLERPFIMWNGSQHSIVMGGYDNRNIYNTLLTSVCEYKQLPRGQHSSRIKAEKANTFRSSLRSLFIQTPAQSKIQELKCGIFYVLSFYSTACSCQLRCLLFKCASNCCILIICWSILQFFKSDNNFKENEIIT